MYEAKEGWGPLCEFLDVGVPEGLPFPRLNGYATIWNLPDKKEQARETQQGRRDSARDRDLQDGQSVPVAAPLKTDPSTAPEPSHDGVRRVERQVMLRSCEKRRKKSA